MKILLEMDPVDANELADLVGERIDDLHDERREALKETSDEDLGDPHEIMLDAINREIELFADLLHALRESLHED